MGRGFNALLGLSRIAARSAKRSLKAQEKAEREWIRKEIRRSKQIEHQRQVLEAQSFFDNFNSKVDFLTRMHLGHVDYFDWDLIAQKVAPTTPLKSFKYENIARNNYDNYKPNIIVRLFNLTEKMRLRLEQDIEAAKSKDLAYFETLKKEYEIAHKEWENNVTLAKNILLEDHGAYRSVMIRIFEKLSNDNFPFQVQINSISRSITKISIDLNSKQNVPHDNVKLLKSGRVSVKPMSAVKYNMLIKDYAFSSTLRIAKEILFSLPIEKLHLVIYDNILPIQHSNKQRTKIIDIIMQRSEFIQLNLEVVSLDDAVKYFNHDYEFNKTLGFADLVNRL